jgi:hypothetical protein
MIDYDFLWIKVRSYLDSEIREEVWSSSGLKVQTSFGLHDRQLLLDVLRETNDFHFLAKLSFRSNLGTFSNLKRLEVTERILEEL